jgi:O-antigen ligase
MFLAAFAKPSQFSALPGLQPQALRRPTLARQALLTIHRLAIGLLPLGLVFWYFRQVTNIQYPRVYFTYDNAIFFLSDALALIAVVAWALATWFPAADAPGREKKTKLFSLKYWSNSITPWIFALCCLASLSILWAKDWRVSLYLSLHLWLGFGLFLSLRDRPDSWRAAMIGFCAALGIQVIAGFAEFASQSTGLLTWLHLDWPGGLEPSMRGASVVQLVDGARWLRVYGTLPHPNILGAWTVVLLSGPAAFFLLKPRPQVWAILLFSGGVALLILTFSRGAWAGFLASALIIVWKSRSLDRKRLRWLGAAGAVSLLAAALPLQTLVFTRVAGAASVPTEAFSIKGREWLAGMALSVIQQRPLLGIGIGSFILNLAQQALPGYIIEPAHSLPLLIVSELGIGGAVILVGLGTHIAWRIWQTREPKAILISAALVGLCATSLFDHSLWTLAPGRIFLALVLGLWAGQIERTVGLVE